MCVDDSERAGWKRKENRKKFNSLPLPKKTFKLNFRVGGGQSIRSSQRVQAFIEEEWESCKKFDEVR